MHDAVVRGPEGSPNAVGLRFAWQRSAGRWLGVHSPDIETARLGTLFRLQCEKSTLAIDLFGRKNGCCHIALLRKPKIVVPLLRSANIVFSRENTTSPCVE